MMNSEVPNTSGLVRRCSAELADGGVCGWFAFDQVTILIDNGPEAAGVPMQVYSCRNCGHLLPDGIPPAIYSQLYGQ